MGSRSIEELQEQNQKLLGVVRELSAEQDAREESLADVRTAQLTERLEATLREVDEIRASRDRHVQLSEAIVRQRDMYKAMLTDGSLQVRARAHDVIAQALRARILIALMLNVCFAIRSVFREYRLSDVRL